MSISNASFTGPKTPVAQLSKVMRTLERGGIEAHFTSERNEPTLSRDYIELAFQEFAIQQQNSQVMNKWITLDTKLDKALLEYLSDVKLLIASVVQTGTAQETLGDSANMPASPGNGMEPQPIEPMSADRGLPVSREQ